MTGLRTLIAAAAITYLIVAMNWHDQVTIPAGRAIGQIPAAATARSARVVAEDDREVRIALGGSTHLLPRSAIGTNAAQLQVTPGILTVLRSIDPSALLAVLLVIACVMPVQALRWWLLLRARGIAPTALHALRLHLIGCFWNCLFPGLTGGDAVKAWQVAQGSGRTSDAIMSVLVDRMLGLLALFLLAAAAGTLLTGSASHQLLTQRVWLVIAVVAPCIALWLSPVLSRVTGIDRLLTWAASKPGLALAIQALIAYRQHHVTVLACFGCSLIGHVLLIGGCILAGHALGIAASWPEMFMLLSLVFLIGAVPISLFGLGVMEVAAVALFGDLASPNQVISMLVVYRLAAIVCSLPGGALIIAGSRWRHYAATSPPAAP
jgi:hypothetical protein